MKRKIITVIFAVLIIGSLYALAKYIHYTSHYVSSDAVFVKSDTLTYLSFQLPGKIKKIYVNEGDKIKKGQLLAKLDTKDLQIQKKEINFSINALQNSVEAVLIQKEKLQNDINANLDLIKNSLSKLESNIKAFEYAINAMKVKKIKLKEDYKRFLNLFKQGKISKEKYQGVKTAYFALVNEIKSNQAKLQALNLTKKDLSIKRKLALNNENEVKRLSKLITADNNRLKSMKEKLAFIDHNIKESFLYAPFEGLVAKKFANGNEVVPAGKIILSVVNLKNLYVLDLLEEKKLKNIKPGCKVKIYIDALGKNFNGTVSKILPASAATFALVPRDISSGEFTKLQQRFFVRIKFDKLPKDVKVGMSGEVTIEKCKTDN